MSDSKVNVIYTADTSGHNASVNEAKEAVREYGNETKKAEKKAKGSFTGMKVAAKAAGAAIATALTAGFGIVLKLLSKLDFTALLHSIGVTDDKMQKFKDTCIRVFNSIIGTIAGAGAAMVNIFKSAIGTVGAYFKGLGKLVVDIFSGKNLKQAVKDFGASLKDAASKFDISGSFNTTKNNTISGLEKIEDNYRRETAQKSGSGGKPKTTTEVRDDLADIKEFAKEAAKNIAKIGGEDDAWTPMAEGAERYATSLQAVLEADLDIQEAEKNAAKALEDKKKALEATTEAYVQLGNAIGSAFTALGDATGDKGLNIAGIIAGAIANIISSFAEVQTKVAAGSLPGPAAAITWAATTLSGIATVAGVVNQIHSLSGYAEGGIVKGNSFHGDQVLARLNSGEMVLNPAQQASLFRTLNNPNGGYAGGGNVTFKIEGRDLIGVIDNNNKITKRLR